MSEPLSSVLESWLASSEEGQRLASVLLAIASAAASIDRMLGREPMCGVAETSVPIAARNPHGDVVFRMDLRAHEALLTAVRDSGQVFVAISEEVKTPISWPMTSERGYVVAFDPLDGSAGLVANAPLGTIFGIYGPVPTHGWRLPAGNEQIAAGYVLYGPATLLVFTLGAGTHMFALDRASGEFVMARANLECPSKGTVYSVSEGNRVYWAPHFRSLVDGYKRVDVERGTPLHLRHVGTLVSDVHQVLVQGGIYAYPSTSVHPDGRLRLVYELAPIAFLFEQAGGRATNGREPILRLVPADAHSRAPFFVGSRAMVDEAAVILGGTRAG